MAEEQTEKEQEVLDQWDNLKKGNEVAEPEDSPEPKETVEEEVQEVNGEDKQEKQRIEGVPYDKEGKRPSDNTIDFEDLKTKLDPETFEQIEGRFKSLYRQTKAQDRYLDQIGKDFDQFGKHVKQVDQKLSQLSESDNITHQSVENLTKTVTELAQKDTTARQQMELQELRQKKVQAYQDMDFEKAADLDFQILQKMSQPQPEVKVEPIKQEAPKQEPTPEPTQEEQQQFSSYQDVKIKSWMDELDNTGNWARPWAHDNHPLNKFAIQQTEALMNHPQLVNADIDTVLTTVDQVMNSMLQPQEQTQTQEQPKQKQPPEVLNSDANLRTKKNEKKLTLSDDQRIVAERIYMNLPKDEAHKRYLKSLSYLEKTGQL